MNVNASPLSPKQTVYIETDHKIMQKLGTFLGMIECQTNFRLIKAFFPQL